MKNLICMGICLLALLLALVCTAAYAQEYYTLPEIREQAAAGWHETYTDKYGRVRQVDIDVEVFGEESAPILVVGWPDDGLQLFYIGDTSPSDAILAAEKGNGVTVYPFDFPTGMKIDLDKQYLEEYENNLTLREMYDFVKEHLQAQGVDQEYVWEQPRVFNIVYSQNKKTESVLVPGYYSMWFWPKYFDLPILSNIANSFVRSLDGPVTSAKLYFDMSNYTEYYGGGTNWDVKEVIAEDIPLCSVDKVIEGAREMIEEGYIHQVISLRFGYVVYSDPNDEWGKQRSLYDMDTIWYLVPSWVMECYILENPKVDKLGKHPNIWEMTINAQTGEMINHFDKSLYGRGDGRYKGFISWDKVK